MKPELKKTEILEMLEALGKAVSDGDLKTISASYGYPALVLSDEQVMLIENREQVEEFFSKAREWYISRGILTTRPELLKFDQISTGIISVEVRWPGFDKNGNENYTETSYYLIHIDGDKPLIRAAASRST
jgi:hypothetical protein